VGHPGPDGQLAARPRGKQSPPKQARRNVSCGVASEHSIHYRNLGLRSEGSTVAKHLAILMLALLTACSSNRDNVTMLATRLAHQGSVGISKEYRDGYIPCGVKTLSKVPSKNIDAALKAPD